MARCSALRTTEGGSVVFECSLAFCGSCYVFCWTQPLFFVNPVGQIAASKTFRWAQTSILQDISGIWRRPVRLLGWQGGVVCMTSLRSRILGVTGTKSRTFSPRSSKLLGSGARPREETCELKKKGCPAVYFATRNEATACVCRPSSTKVWFHTSWLLSFCNLWLVQHDVWVSGLAALDLKQANP